MYILSFNLWSLIFHWPSSTNVVSLYPPLITSSSIIFYSDRLTLFNFIEFVLLLLSFLHQFILRSLLPLFFLSPIPSYIFSSQPVSEDIIYRRGSLTSFCTLVLNGTIAITTGERMILPPVETDDTLPIFTVLQDKFDHIVEL